MKALPLEISLFRHGELIVDAQGRLVGHADLPLSKRGERQAQWWAREFQSFSLDAVYSSDLQRARYGAEVLAAPRGLSVQALPAWREIDVGAWQMRRYSELDNQAITHCFSDPATFAYPGGESFAAFAERITQALQALRSRHPKGGHVALVAHGGVTRAVLGLALELPINSWLRLAQDYACLNRITWYENSPPTIQLMNRVPAEYELKTLH
jgi:probable phosphoglycerate mutase